MITQFKTFVREERPSPVRRAWGNLPLGWGLLFWTGGSYRSATGLVRCGKGVDDARPVPLGFGHGGFAAVRLSSPLEKIISNMDGGFLCAVRLYKWMRNKLTTGLDTPSAIRIMDGDQVERPCNATGEERYDAFT